MTYDYILNEEMKIYYVLRAPSLCEARDREAAFKKAFGDAINVFIISPFEWDFLSKRLEIRTLEV